MAVIVEYDHHDRQVDGATASANLMDTA